MKPKIIDSHFTAFWGVFLNLGCNLRCPYCIQRISLPNKKTANYSIRPGKDWVEALNAISGRTKKRFLRLARIKKLSILGGEPTIYPDFLYVINHLDRHWKITVTTNFDSPFFEQDLKFYRQIKNRNRLRFNGSWHFLQTPLEKFIANVRKLKKAGINVHTLFLVAHPGYLDKIHDYKNQLLAVHQRVKLQRFLGFYQGRLYPQAASYNIAQEQIDGIANYALYQQGFGQKDSGAVFCHSDKVLIAPNGDIYNCHYKVYTNHPDRLANLFEAEVNVHIPREFFFCREFGFCNPCDSEGHLFKTKDGKIRSMGRAD
ncbi:MAG: radical SAM protein [Candidatus Omnitrophica bacterium]|nr:radical SAM protein [Candidatus Omnitrophota bacterium]